MASTRCSCALSTAVRAKRVVETTGTCEARVPLSAGGDAVRGTRRVANASTKTENQTSSIVQHDNLGGQRAGTGDASGGGDWHCQSGPVLLVRPRHCCFVLIWCLLQFPLKGVTLSRICNPKGRNQKIKINLEKFKIGRNRGEIRMTICL